MSFNNRRAGHDNWRTNFPKGWGIGKIVQCAEDFCENTFTKRGRNHLYCDECRAERKKLAHRRYDAKRVIKRKEARRKARLARIDPI